MKYIWRLCVFLQSICYWNFDDYDGTPINLQCDVLVMRNMMLNFLQFTTTQIHYIHMYSRDRRRSRRLAVSSV